MVQGADREGDGHSPQGSWIARTVPKGRKTIAHGVRTFLANDGFHSTGYSGLPATAEQFRRRHGSTDRKDCCSMQMHQKAPKLLVVSNLIVLCGRTTREMFLRPGLLTVAPSGLSRSGDFGVPVFNRRERVYSYIVSVRSFDRRTVLEPRW